MRLPLFSIYGLINLFLIKQTVVDAHHNILHMVLLSKFKLQALDSLIIQLKADPNVLSLIPHVTANFTSSPFHPSCSFLFTYCSTLSWEVFYHISVTPMRMQPHNCSTPLIPPVCYRTRTVFHTCTGVQALWRAYIMLTSQKKCHYLYYLLSYSLCPPDICRHTLHTGFLSIVFCYL